MSTVNKYLISAIIALYTLILHYLQQRFKVRFKLAHLNTRIFRHIQKHTLCFLKPEMHEIIFDNRHNAFIFSCKWSRHLYSTSAANSRSIVFGFGCVAINNYLLFIAHLHSISITNNIRRQYVFRILWGIISVPLATEIEDRSFRYPALAAHIHIRSKVTRRRLSLAWASNWRKRVRGVDVSEVEETRSPQCIFGIKGTV